MPPSTPHGGVAPIGDGIQAGSKRIHTVRPAELVQLAVRAGQAEVIAAPSLTLTSKAPGLTGPFWRSEPSDKTLAKDSQPNSDYVKITRAEFLRSGASISAHCRKQCWTSCRPRRRSGSRSGSRRGEPA